MPDHSLTETPRPTTRARVESVIVWVVFGLYLVFLLKLLLFSRVTGLERSINLIPFASIGEYLGGPASVQRFAFANIAGNILVFVPLGGYLAFLRRKPRIWSNVLMVAGASGAVEVLQWVFEVGTSDIDDVILNSLGGLLGVLAVVALRSKARPDRVRTMIAVASVVAVPVLLFLTVVVRLRI